VACSVANLLRHFLLICISRVVVGVDWLVGGMAGRWRVNGVVIDMDSLAHVVYLGYGYVLWGCI